jgi:hypothetical protein
MQRHEETLRQAKLFLLDRLPLNAEQLSSLLHQFNVALILEIGQPAIGELVFGHASVVSADRPEGTFDADHLTKRELRTLMAIATKAQAEGVEVVERRSYRQCLAESAGPYRGELLEAFDERAAMALAA